MPRVLKELPRLVREARSRGFHVSGGSNGGGWHRLASALGYVGPSSKLEAKAYIRQKLDGTPREQTIAAAEKKKAAFVARRTSADYSGDVNAPDFLQSYAWRHVRMQALKKYGPRCMCCGATPDHGAVMNVDHIKPRRLFPHLALDLENLQILCHECNHGKGNWDQTDWRPSDELVDSEVAAMIRDIAKFG